jgi:D(-)-tartrate dehydratase
VHLTAIRETTIPLASEMRNAIISFASRTASLVTIETDEVRDGRSVVGYGYTAPGRYGQAGPLNERFIPRLLRASRDDLIDGSTGIFDPAQIQQVAARDEKPGGHGERAVALAALDLAAWDLATKLQGASVASVLASGTDADELPRPVPVYAAGGYYYGDDAGHDRLRGELRGYLDQGYALVKIKIGGASLGQDLERIEASLEEIGTRARLAVDANAAFDLDTALVYADALARYPIAWYEEPLRPLDLAGLQILSEAYEGPLATGENLFSEEEVELLLRFGGLRPGHDKLQVDAGLAYGLTGLLRILDTAREFGWSPDDFVPHGGHLANLAAASGLVLGGAEAYPALFHPISGFGGARIESGSATPSDAPGLGVEHHHELLAAFAIQN